MKGGHDTAHCFISRPWIGLAGPLLPFVYGTLHKAQTTIFINRNGLDPRPYEALLNRRLKTERGPPTAPQRAFFDIFMKLRKSSDILVRKLFKWTSHPHGSSNTKATPSLVITYYTVRIYYWSNSKQNNFLNPNGTRFTRCLSGPKQVLIFRAYPFHWLL